MYGLYRAWFGEGDYPRFQEALSPPDTLVRVGNDGEHQFVAHKGVLAAHSGYLKALLANASSAGSGSFASSASGIPVTATNVTGQQPRHPVTSVSVSSIGGEAFAPLLHYMYTGRLEVTMDNVYSVLLATHLLHMPGALEQCRAALLRLRAPLPMPVPTTTASGSVLRPIPNRLVVGPPLCWPQPSSIYPSLPAAPVGLPHLSQLQPSILMQHNVPPISVMPGVQETREDTSAHYSDRQQGSPKPLPVKRPRSRSPEVTSPSTIPFSAAFTSFSSKSSPSPSPSSISRSPTPTPKSMTDRSKSEDRKSETEGPSDSNTEISVTGSDRPRSSKKKARSSDSSVISVVYDVACCDGPVKFHRVLNENYRGASLRLQRQFEGESVSENDENGGPEARESGEVREETGSYTCGYCRHSFKSQYCYRKHAKRHLLPTRVSEGQRKDSSRGRREVRLLDLNVQYYPCKICGCKFPSYYFVHKHRKLCHANVDDRGRTGSADNDGEEEAAASENS